MCQNNYISCCFPFSHITEASASTSLECLKGRRFLFCFVSFFFPPQLGWLHVHAYPTVGSPVLCHGWLREEDVGAILPLSRVWHSLTPASSFSHDWESIPPEILTLQRGSGNSRVPPVLHCPSLSIFFYSVWAVFFEALVLQLIGKGDSVVAGA